MGWLLLIWFVFYVNLRNQIKLLLFNIFFFTYSHSLATLRSINYHLYHESKFLSVENKFLTFKLHIVA